MYSPKEIANNYVATGTAKANLPAAKMLLLGILAGMFIALAGVGAVIAPVTIQSASLAKLIGAFVFPVGLAMVLIAGSELFTGNNLIIISVLERETRVALMLKNWFFVYIGNFIGGVLVAFLTVKSGTFSLFNNDAAGALIHAAIVKVNLSFGDALLRGILCNFIVCIAVWMAYAAKDIIGKIAGMFLPIMLFVLSGYEHSVANMFYISGGLFAATNPHYAAAIPMTDNLSSLTWGTMFTGNLIPVTIGNIIGGALLVGCVYWFVYVRDTDKAKSSNKKR